ncbi:DUF5954 family protein [Streptomyces polygonati]|uniref:DUF5954 family protein n=1 Tax=Streptomyces polygonati TaxID=1617087 RepID=A0ABV8HPR5_9ACTN
MGSYEDEVPAYLTIRVTAQDSPIAAFAEQEAWQARERYPDLARVGLGEFFWASEEDSGGWKLCEHGGSWPQQARDSLGSHFRLQAQLAERAGEEKAARGWMAGAHRTDREVVDDLRVMGQRFRIVRASHFIRRGGSGPEPPRPSDPDPGEVGEANRLPSRTKDFVVDPYTGTGLSEGILKLDLIHWTGVGLGGGQEAMHQDALRAARDYPGGVLLPAVFVVSDRQDGDWQLHSPGESHGTPQGARDSLAVWLRVMAPFSGELTDAEVREYARAADRLDDRRSNVAAVGGHRFRITRVERLVRIGPNGPEGPRPSDPDPEAPIEIQVAQLKAQGLWEEEDDEGPVASGELDEGALRLREMAEREEQRHQAAKEARRLVREQRAKGLIPPEGPAGPE